MRRLTHLDSLEAEALHVFREVAAEFERPVLLFSGGKDSMCLVHLARKAFAPGRPPFPLLHVATGWDFRELLAFRDAYCAEHRLKLEVTTNAEGVAAGVTPFQPGSGYSHLMQTQALVQALKAGRHDAAFGGARRDEEKARAKERIYSFRDAAMRWDPRNQRPELWNLYNGRVNPGESIRAFPLSNWTELDVWLYIEREQIPLPPLYFAAPRPVVDRAGRWLVVDDGRFPLMPGEVPVLKSVRFRTLGDYPTTAATESTATTVREILSELLATGRSEREGRLIDHEENAAMETRKREGYF